MPPANFKDMTGQRFTRLVVLSRAKSDTNGNARWNCRCDCGNATVSSGFTLRNGEAKSCGCLTTEQLTRRATKHSKSHTSEWWSWVHMIQRCDNPNNAGYKWYGERGIKVCERWYDFENFYADMGPKTSPRLSIERKDYNGNYEPGNCIWGTSRQQSRNKRNNRWVVYQEKRMTLTGAIELAGSGMSLGAVRGRLKRGWPLEKAVETPPSPYTYIHAWGRARGST